MLTCHTNYFLTSLLRRTFTLEMTTVWNAESPDSTHIIQQSANFLKKLFDSYPEFAEINKNLTKTFSLYKFMLEHKNTPVDSLHSRILENGKYIFTKPQLEEIMKIVRSQASSSFARRLVNTHAGGAGETIVDDPSRSKFWDKFIRKVTRPLVSRIPSKFDGLFWYMFILYNIEQVDFIGPFVATVLDAVTLSLPVMASMAKETVNKLFQIAPVPYAGLAGEVIGYGVGLIFLSIAFSLNVGRRHFGMAFKNMLESMPFIGDILVEASTQFGTGAERYSQTRKRMIASFNKYSPHTANVLEYWSPSVNSTPATTEGPIMWDPEKVKLDLVQKTVGELGLKNTKNIVEHTKKFTGEGGTRRQRRKTRKIKTYT